MPHLNCWPNPFLKFVHPDDREMTLFEVGKLAGPGASVNFENRFLTKKGTYRWLSWKALSEPDEGLIYGIARDFTESRRAQEKLQKAKKG